jgi:hypothetical protein
LVKEAANDNVAQFKNIISTEVKPCISWYGKLQRNTSEKQLHHRKKVGHRINLFSSPFLNREDNSIKL